jgi:hypothetical protein
MIEDGLHIEPYTLPAAVGRPAVGREAGTYGARSDRAATDERSHDGRLYSPTLALSDRAPDAQGRLGEWEKATHYPKAIVGAAKRKKGFCVDSTIYAHQYFAD